MTDKPMSAEELASAIMDMWLTSKAQDTPLVKSAAAKLVRERDAALSATQVPEGWKLVPIDEPTNKMLSYIHDAMRGMRQGKKTADLLKWSYKMMIAAAPKAPTAAPDAYKPDMSCDRCGQALGFHRCTAPAPNQSGGQ